MPKKDKNLTDERCRGLLFAERLFLYQNNPNRTVTQTDLKNSLKDRRKIVMPQNKIGKAVEWLTTTRRLTTGNTWLQRKGNSITITEIEKILRDHRSAKALLTALTIQKHDISQIKIVFDIEDWKSRLQSSPDLQLNLSSVICGKFLEEYRKCDYTAQRDEKEEELHRDAIVQERNILEAVAECEDIFRAYDV